MAKLTGLNDTLSIETLRTWQLHQVRETIEYARDHSKLYSQRLQGVDTGRVWSLEDMQAIPFTWPEDLTRDPTSLVCIPAKEIARIVTLSTSGTQGAPKRVFFTEHDMEKTMDFFACGMSTMLDSGQSAVIFLSGDTQHSAGDLLGKALARIGVSARIHGHIKDIPKAIDAAKAADCLVGVPAEIMYMCRTDGSLRPNSVLLSADYVPRSVIEGVEGIWKCRVFTHYGMTEMGFGIGVQCEARSGYHLRDADLLVEIVDPRTGLQVPPGQSGEVVITTLDRKSMPFIRYRTGDIAHMLSGPCVCGGTLPQLGKVMGRQVNTIFLENEERLSIHHLDEIMFSIPEIRNYEARLIRTSGSRVLSLTVDVKGNLEHEGLIEYLRKVCPCRAEIRIEFDRVSPYTGSGKRSISLESAKTR